MTILFIATYIIFSLFITITTRDMAALGDDTAKELTDFMASISKFAFVLWFLLLPILVALAMISITIEDLMKKR